MLIFYQFDRPASLISPSKTTRILSDGRQALAIHQGARSTSALIASDSMLSSVVTVSADNFQSLSHSAFGFYQPTSELLVGYKGERCDAISAMYGLGAGYRWYSPTIMRFSSPDSVSPFGIGGINAYTYVHNNPVNLADPDGHAPRPAKFNGKEMLFHEGLERIYDFGNDRGVFRTLPQPESNAKPKLIIRAHGDSKSIGVDDGYLKPAAFGDWLKSKNIYLKDYRNLTLFSCGTGVSEGGRASFAQQFATANKITVKAPKGIIWTVLNHNQDPTKFDLGMQIEPHAGFYPVPEFLYTYESVFRLTQFKPRPAQQIRKAM